MKNPRQSHIQRVDLADVQICPNSLIDQECTHLIGRNMSLSFLCMAVSHFGTQLSRDGVDAPSELQRLEMSLQPRSSVLLSRWLFSKSQELNPKSQ